MLGTSIPAAANSACWRQRPPLRPGNAGRFEEMKTFFEGVGEGHAAGVWEDVPKDRPEFKAKRRKAAAAKPVEEMGSC